MGVYRNGGTVFTAATTDWSRGLTGGWNAVSQITQTVIRRLSCPCPPSPRIANSGFETSDADEAPEDWAIEGGGAVRTEAAAACTGRSGLLIDARAGQTWVSQEITCEGRNFYQVECWAKATKPGATIRLQSTTSWRDFAIAEHSGGGDWERLCAVGMLADEGALFAARVKIEVAEGVLAWFDNVAVRAL
jgi:hypothetical protein